jgi:hypothetical protein
MKPRSQRRKDRAPAGIVCKSRIAQMRTSRFETAGRRWEVRTSRVRMPPWREVDLGFDETGVFQFDIGVLLVSLIALPFTLVLIPLAIAVVETPVAVVRSFLSGDVWVEATSHYPGEIRYLWRTTRADAAVVHASVAASLSLGATPDPPRAELVERPHLP